MPSRLKTSSTGVSVTSYRYNGSSTTSVAEYDHFSENSTWQNSPRDSHGRLLLKPNSCNMYWIKRKHGLTKYRKTHYRYPEKWMGTDSFYVQDWPYSTVVSGTDWSAQYDLAAWSFYNTLTDIDAHFALIFLERKQTINLLTSNIRRLTSLYTSLRRGRNPFKGHSKIPSKDASNYWLEYTYGWLPLVMDTYDLLNLGDIEPPPFTLSKSRSSSKSLKIVDPNTSDPYYGEKIWTATVKYRTTLSGSVSIRDPGYQFLSQIGLTNPALIVWELMPYSFVVDWFLPIGSWLQWHAGLHYADVSGTSITKSTRQVYNCVKSGASGSYYGDWYTTNTSCESEVKTKSREVKPIGAPELTFRWPDDWRQGVSALALMRQRFN